MTFIRKVLAIATLIAPATSFAHLPYKAAECAQFSKFIYLAAKAKDGGIAKDKILIAAEKSTFQLAERGDSFIQDKSDAEAALAYVNLVLSQEMSASMQMAAALDDCSSVLMSSM